MVGIGLPRILCERFLQRLDGAVGIALTVQGNTLVVTALRLVTGARAASTRSSAVAARRLRSFALIFTSSSGISLARARRQSTNSASNDVLRSLASNERVRSLSARDRLSTAPSSGARGARALTTRLNAVYRNESSEVDPTLKYAQLERLSREAW